MYNKLLVIKQGKNVLIYNVVYNAYSLNEYFKYLDSVFGYTEKVEIDTILENGVVLSMNEYDMMKDRCHVKDDYKIIKEIEKIDENKKKVRIEIEVNYFSKITQILKETFLNEEPLLNTTGLIKLMHSLYGMPNNFKFDSLLDNNKKTNGWDDPRNWDLSDSEISKYSGRINERLNSNDVELNKKEKVNSLNIMYEIVEELQSYILIEQVGMFPMSAHVPEFQELLQAFAVRNEDAELFFGSLENVNVNYAGVGIINNRKDEICRCYNFNYNDSGAQKRKNRMDIFNNFLKF